MSDDDVALTSFLMSNFPDQYLFVLQYWVSSTAISREKASREIFGQQRTEYKEKTDWIQTIVKKYSY